MEKSFGKLLAIMAIIMVVNAIYVFVIERPVNNPILIGKLLPTTGAFLIVFMSFLCYKRGMTVKAHHHLLMITLALIVALIVSISLGALFALKS